MSSRKAHPPWCWPDTSVNPCCCVVLHIVIPATQTVSRQLYPALSRSPILGTHVEAGLGMTATACTRQALLLNARYKLHMIVAELSQVVLSCVDGVTSWQ